MAHLNNSLEIESLFDKLWPIPRSISGQGFRDSLKILSDYIPLELGGVASGEKVFDWEVPQEWQIDDAYLIGPDGDKILDFKKDNLSIVNYSEPVDKLLELDELQHHLHSIEASPSWTPYVTSYYKKAWGFCLPHAQRLGLKKGKYHAVIKSAHVHGHIEYGDYFLRGTEGSDQNRKLILITSYLCHPSLANNELSGPIVLAALYQRILNWKKRSFDYLFLINPETIGSICYLSKNAEMLAKKMQAGVVLTCLGGPGARLSYKKSRGGFSSLDKIFSRLHDNDAFGLRNFDPTEGSDERQYCAGSLNLPVGQIARTIYGDYPEYHTSADNKEFVRLEGFLGTISQIESALLKHDNFKPLVRSEPNCEIQLGKRDLYPNTNSPNTWNTSSDQLIDEREQFRAIKYLLSYADGNHDLNDIAELSDIELTTLQKYSNILLDKNILKGN